MAGKIQCTFEDCYRHFDSVESMKKHKAKDPAHCDFYCKKCDEDCNDDTEYLIHQITSLKHIACPLCGVEFKSHGGLERHVGILHRTKQKIKCVGCGETFDAASGLMGHIENNKCKHITRDDFHKHRAEQQIERDAFEEMTGGLYHGASAISGRSSDTTHELNLLDDQRVPSDLDWDWQSAAAEDLRRAGYGSYVGFVGMPGTITERMSDLAIDKYPPLTATTASLSGRRRLASDTTSDTNTAAQGSSLLDLSKEPEVKPSRPLTGNHNVWALYTKPGPQPSQESRPQPQSPPLPSRSVSGSGNLLDFDSAVNGTDFRTPSSVATRGTKPSQVLQASIWGEPIPSATGPENQDSNAPYAQVQTKPRFLMPSPLDLQRYWNAISQCYICPGSKCGWHLKSVKDFQDHLLSGAHVGGIVQCPSCLKRFKTTTALVAHAESGSTRCGLRDSAEYDLVMRSITAGIIKVDGTWTDGSHKYAAVPVDQW